VTPSATSENKNRELIGLSPISRSFVASCVRLQLRPLPSTGIARLRRYYEPLRHPSQPGLSLTSCQLIHTATTAGTSRVAHGPLCLHAVANTPAGLMEFVRSYDSISFGLPRNRGGSAPALVFSRPAQRSLTLRPTRSPGRLRDPLHQRLQQLRCLHCCSDCYRVERTSSRAGLPPLWTTAFSRRTRFSDLSGLASHTGIDSQLYVAPVVFEHIVIPPRYFSVQRPHNDSQGSRSVPRTLSLPLRFLRF